MIGTAKNKSFFPPALSALWTILFLVVALFLPETRVWGFTATPQPTSGVFASVTPSSIGENYDGCPYDASDSLLAVKGLATGADDAVFWSGIGRGGDVRAANWVSQHGGSTLETTMAARGIKLPTWDPNNAATVAAWRQASTDFAAGARGNVRVLQGDSLRIDAIWRDEFKALQANPNVNSIRSINPDSGAEVLLWSR